MEEIPPLSSFLKSPVQMEDLEEGKEVEIRFLRGKRGSPGTPGKDATPPTREEIISMVAPILREIHESAIPSSDELQDLIKPLIPAPKHGETPSREELESLIIPLIPEIKQADLPSEKDFLKLIKPLIPAPIEGSPDTGKEIVEKINKTKGEKIKRSRVEGLDEVEGIARTSQRQVQNFLSLGGSRQTAIKVSGTLLGTGINTINFVGATGAKIGDGSEVNVTTSGGGTGQVNSIVAGTGISVNSTDPANPIVSATGTATGYQAPLSGGLTGTNTWTTAPNVIVVDGVPRQKTQTDGTVNWSGTTTTVLTGAPLPTFDIFATA